MWNIEASPGWTYHYINAAYFRAYDASSTNFVWILIFFCFQSKDVQAGGGGVSPGEANKALFLEKVRLSNAACQTGDFEKAISLYSEAIAMDKNNHILYSNR